MERRLGVLALGDSITNGGGELQWGVALQSWAMWTARGLGVPYTGLAMDGACVGDVVKVQLPFASGPYDVGCLYVGVNDVRSGSWDELRFEEGVRVVLGFLAERCDRVLAVTLPVGLGRPRAAHVDSANAAIERAAAACGALVLDLRRFGARNLVMADAVHPTAFGQIWIAERALDVLAADGMTVRVRPSSLISYETTRWRRLRGDATYLYRRLKQAVRNAARRV
jgi:lysophospholipase L1-like esterase